MNKSSVFISLIMLMLVIGASIVYIAYMKSGNSSNPQLIANISLLDPNKIYRLAPMVKYKLSNGTVITVYKRNPFNFSIIVDVNSSQKPPSRLTVYKVNVRRNESEIFKLAARIGVDAKRLFYNNVTGTYLFHNNTCTFEYTVRNGFLRSKLNNEIKDNGNTSFPSDDVLINKALEFLRSNGLFSFKDYDVKVGDYYKKDDRVLIKAVVFQAKFNGIRAGNLGLMVLLDQRGSIIGFEGIIPLSIEKIGEYPVIPLDDIPVILKKKIANGDPMRDWYISWLAFTKLYIKDIRLQYYMTFDGYLVPIYVFKGEYTLDYDEIQDKGEVHGVLLAIKDH